MSIKFIQLQALPLEAFLNSSDTSFDVAGFLYNDRITKVAPADIGDICYATLEPRTEREELISFTIDSVTSAGVATITAVRGLSQKSPYAGGGATFDHQAGSNLVISNNPGLFNKLAAKANDEVITGAYEFPAPTKDASPVTKQYLENEIARIEPRVSSTASGDITPTKVDVDRYIRTAQAAAITISNPTMKIGEVFAAQLTDNGTARAITFGTDYVGLDGLALPTTTTASKVMSMVLEKVTATKVLVSYVNEA